MAGVEKNLARQAKSHNSISKGLRALMSVSMAQAGPPIGKQLIAMGEALDDECRRRQLGLILGLGECDLLALARWVWDVSGTIPPVPESTKGSLPR